MERRIETTLKLIANRTRLKILFTLFSGKYCVNELTRLTGISQSLVSQSLSKFRAAGIIDVKRKGNAHIYCIKDRKLFNILLKLKEHFENE